MASRKFNISYYFTIAVIMAVIASCISCAPAINGNLKLDSRYLRTVSKSAVKVNVERLIDTSKISDIVGADVFLDKGSGSGTVVAVKNGRSLILTAAHVCVDTTPVEPIPGIVLPVLTVEFTVTTLSGQVIDGSVLVKDDKNDVCVLEIAGVAGTVMEIADALPDVGEEVSYVGAPLGVWHPNAVPLIVGRYDGLIFDSRAGAYKLMLSMPIAGGASGSGLIHNGKLVGVVIEVYRNFNNLGHAADLASVKRIVRLAKERWLA